MLIIGFAILAIFGYTMMGTMSDQHNICVASTFGLCPQNGILFASIHLEAFRSFALASGLAIAVFWGILTIITARLSIQAAPVFGRPILFKYTQEKPKLKLRQIFWLGLHETNPPLDNSFQP